MKISREARNKYLLGDFTFSEKGNVVFDGDIYAVRLFAEKINQKRDLINYPEIAIKAGHFNGMALIFEINNYIYNLYKEKTNNPELNEELFEHLVETIGPDRIQEAIEVLVEEFPPVNVYKNEIKTKEFLEDKDGSIEKKVAFIDEFVDLWLGNTNPSFSPYLEFFDDERLEKNTVYQEIIDEIERFFDDKPTFGPLSQNLFEMLRTPFEEHPHSVKEQLEYMHEHWDSFLDKYLYRILIALDLIREEEFLRGLGPGEAQIYEYDMLEFENFTPDKDWMPKVVMIAKNAYVWLEQLSQKYGRLITKLHEIPDEELDKYRGWGFNALWLIGLWERSQASKTIKRWCGNPEAEASAYSLYDYVIAYDLGGYESYKNLKERAQTRGIRLASDMVPNHTGIVSKWTMEHPDWYISLPYSPFPSYNYSGVSLSPDPNIGIFVEDKYFTRSDAAVTFKRVNYRTGDTRYIYHGNDGTSFPWNDTAQLNFLNPDVREAVIQTILHVSRLFPIIRFDAAMTLTRKHFQRLWFPEPGTGGAIPSRAEHGITRKRFLEAIPHEFWREVVDRINQENPDTLLLAEAFWLLEGYFVRTLGMHRVYNSAFMNMLRDEDNAKYRAVMKNTLEFDPEILKRFVNFMNNPDEETAIKQFGDGDKYFGICTLMATLPGLPMFGHGQVEGYKEKYGMEYRRSYWDEGINQALLKYHEMTIFPLLKKRYLFADVKNFLLYDFWTGNHVNEDVFAYSNQVGYERALIIYHNKYAETRGYIRNSVGFAIKDGEDKHIIQRSIGEGLSLPREGYCIFKDYVTGLEYIRRNSDLIDEGLYIELHAFQRFVFMDFKIKQDNEFFHYAQLHDLLGGKGVHDINNTLQSMIFQPLHAPFQKIISTKSLSNLLNPKTREITIEALKTPLFEFLIAAREYSNGQSDIPVLIKEIIDDLRVSLNLNELLKDLELDEFLKNFMNEAIPGNELEWCIMFSYVLMRKMGKVHSKNGYELRSRSWLDEWNLSKYLQFTIDEINTLEGMKSWEALQLIKIMINSQNFFGMVDIHKIESSALLRKLLNIIEIQQFLKFNRFQNILWFNAESFNVLLNWFSLIILIDSLLKPSDEKIDYIENYLKIIHNWKSNAKKSGYQVEKLLELV